MHSCKLLSSTFWNKVYLVYHWTHPQGPFSLCSLGSQSVMSARNWAEATHTSQKVALRTQSWAELWGDKSQHWQGAEDNFSNIIYITSIKKENKTQRLGECISMPGWDFFLQTFSLLCGFLLQCDTNACACTSWKAFHDHFASFSELFMLYLGLCRCSSTEQGTTQL